MPVASEIACLDDIFPEPLKIFVAPVFLEIVLDHVLNSSAAGKVILDLLAGMRSLKVGKMKWLRVGEGTELAEEPVDEEKDEKHGRRHQSGLRAVVEQRLAYAERSYLRFE